MPDTIPTDSVGVVQSKTIHIKKPIRFECGKTLPEFTLAYETYGSLNADASNAILICHALSGDQHAAGYHSMDDKRPGWWDVCIGPGKPFDTDRFFVVCPNNPGGCGGSSGPNRINPDTGKHYALNFPIVTVRDWVESQKMLADELHINRWAAVAGGSLGGMQAMQWAISYPDKLRHAIIIAAAAKLSAQNIAFNEVARQAILSDSAFNNGNYYTLEPPRRGLMLARMLGHITYLSDEAMRKKFGRRPQKEGNQATFTFREPEFQVQGYLQYQGKSFVDRFDANTYLLMTKVLDYFDPAAAYNDDLSMAFAEANVGFMLASFDSDWRFSPLRSREIVTALLKARRNVTYTEITAPQGHDAFLMNIPPYLEALKTYMHRVTQEH